MGNQTGRSDRQSTVDLILSSRGNLASGRGALGENDEGIRAFARQQGISRSAALSVAVSGARKLARQARANGTYRNVFGDNFGQTLDNVRRLAAAASPAQRRKAGVGALATATPANRRRRR